MALQKRASELDDCSLCGVRAVFEVLATKRLVFVANDDFDGVKGCGNGFNPRAPDAVASAGNRVRASPGRVGRRFKRGGNAFTWLCAFAHI